MSQRGRGGKVGSASGRNGRFPAATEAEAQRLFESLLLVETAAGAAAKAPDARRSSGLRSVTRDGESSHGGRVHHHRRDPSHFPRPPGISAEPSLRRGSPPPESSPSGLHRNSAGSYAADVSSPGNGGPPPSPLREEATPAAGGTRYFVSSCGLRVRLWKAGSARAPEARGSKKRARRRGRG
eukprot:g2051.t2